MSHPSILINQCSPFNSVWSLHQLLKKPPVSSDPALSPAWMSCVCLIQGTMLSIRVSQADIELLLLLQKTTDDGECELKHQGQTSNLLSCDNAGYLRGKLTLLTLIKAILNMETNRRLTSSSAP